MAAHGLTSLRQDDAVKSLHAVFCRLRVASLILTDINEHKENTQTYFDTFFEYGEQIFFNKEIVKNYQYKWAKIGENTRFLSKRLQLIFHRLQICSKLGQNKKVFIRKAFRSEL